MFLSLHGCDSWKAIISSYCWLLDMDKLPHTMKFIGVWYIQIMHRFFCECGGMPHTLRHLSLEWRCPCHPNPLLASGTHPCHVTHTQSINGTKHESDSHAQQTQQRMASFRIHSTLSIHQSFTHLGPPHSPTLHCRARVQERGVYARAVMMLYARMCSTWPCCRITSRDTRYIWLW